MAKLLYGSINFDELLAQIRTGTINTEIVTRKNGETILHNPIKPTNDTVGFFYAILGN